MASCLCAPDAAAEDQQTTNSTTGCWTGSKSPANLLDQPDHRLPTLTTHRQPGRGVSENDLGMLRVSAQNPTTGLTGTPYLHLQA
jgi:hypothetical protein